MRKEISEYKLTPLEALLDYFDLEIEERYRGDLESMFIIKNKKKKGNKEKVGGKIKRVK